MSATHFNAYFIPVWRQAPLLRILLPFASGILTGYYLILDFSTLLVSSCTLAVTSMLLAGLTFKKHALLSSVMLKVSLFFTGVCLCLVNDAQRKANFIGKIYSPGQTIVATLLEPPVPKAKSIKAEASVQLLTANGTLHQASGKCLLYLAKSAETMRLNYGSVLLFNKSLQPIRNAGNPGSFDYKAYAARQGIYYQVFLKANEVSIASYQAGNRFRGMFYDARQWILHQLAHYIPGPNEHAVAQALLIGYRGDLDKALVEKYASTGVVHIIAISGMHLGMIYVSLLLLLRPLGQGRSMEWIRLLLVLTVIWFFTILTGAAPSISRAAIMFTFMSAGQIMSRKSSIYNNLSAAALLLLMIDPASLWDVGFQLSFAAVLSIAIFYQPIRQLWTHTNLLARHTWELMAVSIAAQILTMPLAVYHFHQFPVYFLVSNLLAVPLSAVALYALLALLAVSWWPPAALLAGWITEKTIRAMNSFIAWVSDLPFNTLSHIQISIAQALLLYGCIWCMGWWWFHQSKSALVAAAAVLLVFMMLNLVQVFNSAKQEKLVVYNVPQYTAMDYVVGRKSTFIGDSSLAEAGFLQNFHLMPSRILHQATSNRSFLLDMLRNYHFRIGKVKITLLRRQLDYRKSQRTRTDILLVSGNPPGNPYRILSLIQCKQIVLDGSNSASRIARWKSAADSLHLRLHSIPQSGAYVVNLAGIGRDQP